MSPVAEIDESAAVRYEALIRISDSIRARKEPQDLFEILVQELRAGDSLRRHRAI